MTIFPKRSDQVTVFALFGQFARCYSVRVKLTDAEISQHMARLSEACPELQITTELVLDHRVFIARGKKAGDRGSSSQAILSASRQLSRPAAPGLQAPGRTDGSIQASRPGQR